MICEECGVTKYQHRYSITQLLLQMSIKEKTIDHNNSMRGALPVHFVLVRTNFVRTPSLKIIKN